MRGEFIDLSGARLYYYAAGTRGSGDPIVLLHGFPTSSHLWTDVVPALPPGHRVVVVDLLGFGRSDPPRTLDISVPGHAHRVMELLDALGIQRACIAGHDVGGGIAQYLAVHHPTRVSRLCLVDSVAFNAWPGSDVRLARALAPLATHMPPGLLVHLLRGRLRRGYADPGRGGRSVELYARPFATAEGRNSLLTHLRALDGRATEALVGALPAIAVPTAILWGGQDPFLNPSLGRRLQSLIPGSTFSSLPGHSHFVPEEAPSAVASTIAALLRQ